MITQKTVHLLFILAFSFGIFSCSNSKIENQMKELSQEEAIQFKTKLIRFIARKPEKASLKTKFDSYFDSYYTEQVRLNDLTHYFKTKQGKIFFIFTRIAPSITLKKVATGGYVVFNEKGDIESIEEVFRTWKKIPEELESTSEFLFEKMVNEEDLSPYYTENSNGKEIIEFPSSEVKYDKKQRTWVSSRIDPLQEYYDEQEAKFEEELKSIKTK
jgi:hypothetical protein